MSIPILRLKDEHGQVHDVAAIRGLSAYQVAVAHGFEGSIQDWLDSLKTGSFDEQLEALAIGIDEIKAKLDEVEIGTPGTDTSDANATASDMRLGSSGYVNGVKVVGNVPSRDADDVNVGTSSVTIPAGIYDEPVTKTISSGSSSDSGTTGTTIKAETITLDATNTLYPIPAGTHTGNGAVKIVTETKTVDAPAPGSAAKEYSATTGKVISKVTVNPIPDTYVQASNTIDAKYWHPSDTDQEIPAGTYCKGTQTIKGDSNYVEENIAYGVSMFGKVGTLTGGQFGMCKNNTENGCDLVFNDIYGMGDGTLPNVVVIMGAVYNGTSDVQDANIVTLLISRNYGEEETGYDDYAMVGITHGGNTFMPVHTGMSSSGTQYAYMEMSDEGLHINLDVGTLAITTYSAAAYWGPTDKDVTQV